MKNALRSVFSVVLLALLLTPHAAIASSSSSGWSFNLGYHNPPGATIGANFMKLWTNFAVELGIGWLDLNSSSRTRDPNQKEDTTTLAVAGDVNMKYLFGSGGIRPYLQAGVGLGSVASAGDSTGIAAGTGGGFFGGGLFFMGQSVYGYASLDSAGGKNTFAQAGIGFGF